MKIYIMFFPELGTLHKLLKPNTEPEKLVCKSPGYSLNNVIIIRNYYI